MLQYDEADLVRRLAAMSKPARVMFAAACAERLQPLYQRFHDLTGQGDPDNLAATLDAVWRVALAGRDQEGLAQWQSLAEDLVPDEEGDSWTPESAYGQHGAAAVAYAVRTWLADDPADAGWAARQVYEAADYAAQQRPELDLNEPDAEQEVLAQPVVQEALAGLAADLAAVDHANHELAGVAAQLREQAHDGGERLARLAIP